MLMNEIHYTFKIPYSSTLKHPECTICTIKKHIYLYCLSDNTTVEYRLPLLSSFICIIYLYSLSLFAICIFYRLFCLYGPFLYIQNVLNRTVWIAFKFRTVCNDNKENSRGIIKVFHTFSPVIN